MATCDNCGAEVFLGEPSCPMCRAKLPPPASDPAGADRIPGGDDAGDATHVPPPEGLDLSVQKGLADRDARREHEARLEEGVGYGYDDGPTFGESVDGLADALSPQRDRHGQVIWDWKTALVGGIIVAIAIGVAIYFITASLNGSPSRVR